VAVFASAGPPELLAVNFVEEVAELFRDQLRDASTMPLSGVAASMDRFPRAANGESMSLANQDVRKRVSS
jgi:hypothetical protein